MEKPKVVSWPVDTKIYGKNYVILVLFVGFSTDRDEMMTMTAKTWN